MRPAYGRPGRLNPPGGNRPARRPVAQAAGGARSSERVGAGVAVASNGILADYVKVKTVGRGSFGEALLVKHRISGHVAVLKRVRLEVAGSANDAAAAAESAAREAQVLQNFRHPNIVEFLGAFVDSSRDASGGTLCLLMEYCEGGDLQQRLQRVRQEGRRLAEQPSLRWFDQLCSAVAYIHQHQVLHRDVKPSNIFLSGRGNSGASVVGDEESVSIGDFGVSRPLMHAMELVTTMVGTPCYLSPEVCKGKPYSYKSDIWSMGCVLFEMMALRPPFGTAPNLEALVNRIVRADVNLPEHLAVEYPEASRCARAMLRQQPERRPTAHALLNRPRLQQPTYELPGLAVPAPPSGAGPLPSSISAPPVAPGPSASFEPLPRSSGCGAAPGGNQAPPRLVAAQVAAAAAAVSAAVTAAACSPRAKGRAKLANKILEAEAEQEIALQAWSESDPLGPAAMRQASAASRGGAGSPGASGGVHQRSGSSYGPCSSPSCPPHPEVVVAVAGSGPGAVSSGAPPPSTGQAERQLSVPGVRQRRSSSSSGAQVRSCSGESKLQRQFAVPWPAPMSARGKAYNPQPWPQAQVVPQQRSPRLSAPSSGNAGVEHFDGAAGCAGGSSPSGGGYRSTSATPRSPNLLGGACWPPMKHPDSPDDPEDPKRKQRREDRSRQSQAFRDWLRQQRAQRNGKDSPGDNNEQESPAHQEQPQAEQLELKVVDERRDAQQKGESFSHEQSHEGEDHDHSQGQRQHQQGGGCEWRTEIYCPGYPVMTVEDKVSPRSRQLENVGAKPVLIVEAKDPEVPPGPADVGGTPLETSAEARPPMHLEQQARGVVLQSAGCEQGVDSSCVNISSDTHGSLECSTAKIFEASLPGTSGLVPTELKDVNSDAGKLISQLDDSKKSVSIGDRIEGIRACLEARIGTSRFQKLYKSLAESDGTASNNSESSVPWPRDSSMVLPEEIDDAFSGAGAGGSDDVNSLIPLVAKLVACEQSYFS